MTDQPVPSVPLPPSPVPALPDLLAEPALQEATAAARDALAELHRHPANRRGWARSAAAASIRAARASAAIEGADPALPPAAGADGPGGGAAVVTDPRLAGAIRAAALLPSLVGVWERSPLQALARLHTAIAAGTVDADLVGRPVRSADRLAALSGWLVRGADGVPGPVLTAVVHLELLTAQAFSTGNGVLARAACRLAGVACGLDPHALGVLEVACWRAGGRYPAAAATVSSSASSGGVDDRRAALLDWLVLHCRWTAEGAREGRSIADAALA